MSLQTSNNNSSNNKRIAKNTIYLYLRMIITTVVSLYTVRVVLDVLGTDDYGIYNIVGGIVVLFSFLNTAMNGATQRFLSYALGKNDDELFQRTFSVSLNCHLILAGGIFLILETVGLWFLYTQMNIPVGRMGAALWVYQFSILTFVTSVVSVPYRASVISYEKMSFYAYLSIFDALANLGIVFLLLLDVNLDKLTLYAGLKFLISVLCWLIYYIYCKKKFDTCNYTLFWDKYLFKKLFGFSGWSMLGAGSVLVTLNGSNILINIYCGVTANAAYGIANQVSSAIYAFVSNFQMAFKPQIVKLYASDMRNEQVTLVNRASIISYFLLLIIFIPFVLNADFVLGLWLKAVPQYAVEFCQWMLVYSLIDAIQAPLWMSITATGKIKVYSIWSSALALLNLPIAWILLYVGLSPVSIFVARVIINFIAALIRVLYIKGAFGFPVRTYVFMVLKRVLPVTVISFVLSYFVNSLFNNTISSFFISVVTVVLLIGIVVYSIGLSSAERKFVLQIIHSKINKT